MFGTLKVSLTNWTFIFSFLPASFTLNKTNLIGLSFGPFMRETASVIPIPLVDFPSILIITSFGWMSEEAAGESFITDWIVNSAVSLLRKSLIPIPIISLSFLWDRFLLVLTQPA